jgi:hypothetical protein
MTKINIRKVANGFIAQEDNCNSQMGMSIGRDSIFVFQSFNALAKWLSQNLDDSPDANET